MQLFSLLDQFGSFSGYKLNVSLILLSFSFNYSPSENIKKRYNLNWEAKSMRYLGVKIPTDLSKLFLFNVAQLDNKIREGIGRWDLIQFLNFGS